MIPLKNQVFEDPEGIISYMNFWVEEFQKKVSKNLVLGPACPTNLTESPVSMES